MGRTSTAREKLIETGSHLFYTRGYNSVGVQEICEAAGINKGSFYHFFPSKKDLVLAIIQSHERYILDHLHEVFSREGTVNEKFQRFFDSIFKRACQIKEACGGVFPGCPVGNLALELTTLDEEIQQRVRRCFRKIESLFANTIREGKGRGECQGVDPEATARALVAYFQGMTLLAKTENSPEVFNETYSKGLLLLQATPQEQEVKT